MAFGWNTQDYLSVVSGMTADVTAIELTEAELEILRCVQEGEPCRGSPSDARAIVARLFELRLIELGRAVTREGGHEQHRIAPTDLGLAVLEGRASPPGPDVRRDDPSRATPLRGRRGRLVLMMAIMVVVVIPDAVALETLSAYTAVGMIVLLACIGLSAAAFDRPPYRAPRTGTRE